MPRLIIAVCFLAAASAAPLTAQQPKPAAKKAEKAERFQAGEADVAEIKARAEKLAAALAKIPEDKRGREYADAAVCHKAAEWIVRHDEFPDAKAVPATLKAVDLGLARAAALAKGRHPWTEAKGVVVGRGYRSRVDGSFQPYAIHVPADYDPKGEPRRLEVVLHGRDGKLTEATFLAGHDGRKVGPDEKALVLEVYGRGNNAYRWAGEADVFEAIDAVKAGYRVDERRIVLRGFSMGGAGAWHLGLHHPSAWCSVEAGAGFSETRKYAKLGDLPEWQAKLLHIYDAVDYAENAFDLPVVGYGGEKDPQQQASINIREALASAGVKMNRDGLITRADPASGLDFAQVVGAGVEHKVDPASAKFLKAWHDERTARAPKPPECARLVTYTLRYNTAPGLTVEGLAEHYKRAEVAAEFRGDTATVTKAENVTALRIVRPGIAKVRIGGRDVDTPAGSVLVRGVDGTWAALSGDAAKRFESDADRAKRHGLQGPVDDAFTGPFLCVRGTGTPWNPDAQRVADARLKRFAAEWDKWMRGRLPVKDDKDLTPDDIAGHHLILFGDPGSNSVLAKVLKDLPMEWTKDAVKLGGASHPAAGHLPVLINPNPLNPRRYVVLNSGHTFGAKEFQGTNALLFPRLGDWAVLPTDKPDEPKAAGLFAEDWKTPRN
jgi:hypothetical protein